MAVFRQKLAPKILRPNCMTWGGNSQSAISMDTAPLEAGYAQFVQPHSGKQNNNLQNVHILIFENENVILADANLAVNTLTLKWKN